MTDLEHFNEAGVSVWLDDLGRRRITSGELSRLVHQVGVRGVTTNPSIFAAAVSGGTEYRQELAAGSGDPVETVQRLMVRDVKDACSVLSDTFTSSDAVDGRVSLEVDPRLAFDTAGTIAAARAAWREVDHPNAMVKIPATEAGLPAITESLAAGISVNVTLIFGIDRYREVQAAWAEGMQQALSAGHDLSQIGSVASFFVSRLDTAVDRRLDAMLTAGGLDEATHAALRGRAAVANARNAYRLFTKARRSADWQALQAAGAHPQRPLWASTSTKDPTFAPTRYVDELIAPDTVNTMPSKTLDAVLSAESVPPALAIDDRTAEADALLFGQLGAEGIDYDDVVEELEREGVQSFIDAWESLLGLVDSAARNS